jgi:NitT/TauT family transport system substrate-binding protein
VAAALAVGVVLSLAAACSSGSATSSSGGGGAAGASSGGSVAGSSAAPSGNLKTINVAASSVAITVGFANYAIEQSLGCFAKAGYKLDVKAYPGTSSALLVALRRGDADMAILGSDQFQQLQQTISKSGSAFPLTAVYESAYPFHWGLAVKPGSSIQSLNDLVGKTVGVDTLGNSSVPLLKAVMKSHGLDPNSVKITATGSGAPVGTALQSGKVDAVFTSDTTFGTILQTGVNVRFITDGSKPLYMNVAGITAIAPTKSVTDPEVKAFDECTSEGNVFVKANPVAAADIMLQQYPTLNAPGKTLEQQLTKLGFSLLVREQTLHSVDPNVPYGQMNEQEFKDNLQYELGQSPTSMDTSKEFTNAYVPTLSAAQVAAITAQAKAYKIPGLSKPITLPALPANTP